jgi:hypothetical protein
MLTTATMPKLNAGERASSTPIRVLARNHDPNRIHTKSEQGWDSYNWSGYAVTGANGSATDVKGSWVVPSVNCSATPDGYSSFWVGIDGFSSNSVEQIGTDSDCVSLYGKTNTPTYYAWFEFYPNPSYEILFPSAIKPGDIITAEVRYAGPLTSGRHRQNGPQFIVTITDVTQNNETYSVSSVVSGAAQSSAEWIAEAPASRSGILPLANFNQVMFSSASATIQNATQALGSFGNNIQELTMVAQSTGNPVKAQPSVLTNGTGFSVAWLSPGP